MTEKQIQELRDNLINAVFACVAGFKSDFECCIDAPEGVTENDMYITNRGDIGYTVSYNHEREMVSLRGNLKRADGSLAEIMSFSSNEFNLTLIIDRFLEFILK